MPTSDKQTMIKEYSDALRTNAAAMFIGAGVSRSAGHVDWRGLLKGIAEELDLDVDRESDLVALAQYHLNDRGGRDKLNKLLIDEFHEGHEPTETHNLIATLPVETIWTTNYDDLIERAFEDVGKRVDVKRRKSDINFTRSRADVTVYKMHGDKTEIADAVLAKDDYETYNLTRELFTIALKGDLTQKTFLFVGVSFTDPNLTYILSRVRQLVDKDGRQHFCVLRRPKPTDYRGAKYDCIRFKHWVADLQRYNIRPVLIDSYSEVPEILKAINRRSHLRNVFISGSAADYGPLGEQKFHDLCHLLGHELIKKNYNVISGFGLGVGGDIITGAMRALSRNNDRRLRLWPFPQQIADPVERAAFWTDYRERMIAEAGICLVISGNKEESSKIVPATGVEEEIRITRTHGKIVLPIGASGHVARKVWESMNADPTRYNIRGKLAKEFRVLGDEAAPVTRIVKAVLAILDDLNK